MRQTATTAPELSIGPYQPCVRLLWEQRPVEGQRSLGSSRELDFWKYFITTFGTKYTTPRPLIPLICAAIAEWGPAPSTPLHILNLGSGAANVLGETGIPVVITCADLLADEYHVLWNQAGLVPYTPIEPQDMTALTYPDNTFDLVCCTNALDHAPDPFRAIQEMARVCRPGGLVYLHHLQAVASSGHYSGLHQWNITMTAAPYEMLVSRRAPSGNEFRITDCVPGFVSRFAPGEKPTQKLRIEAVYRKPLQ